MSDDIIRQLKYAASEPCNADCCFSETMGQAAKEQAAFTKAALVRKSALAKLDRKEG